MVSVSSPLYQSVQFETNDFGTQSEQSKTVHMRGLGLLSFLPPKVFILKALKLEPKMNTQKQVTVWFGAAFPLSRLLHFENLDFGTQNEHSKTGHGVVWAVLSSFPMCSF